MEQEILFKTLIEELMKIDSLHREYKDNETHFVVDALKEGNTLNIKVQLIENKDKKEFEKWLEQVDDDIFSEVLDELREKEGLTELNTLYDSENYKQVIDKVKAKTKEIVLGRIRKLKSIIN